MFDECSQIAACRQLLLTAHTTLLENCKTDIQPHAKKTGRLRRSREDAIYLYNQIVKELASDAKGITRPALIDRNQVRAVR